MLRGVPIPRLQAGIVRRIALLHTSASLASKSRPSQQHVLYLGSVLGYVSPGRLSNFPRSWLDSVGMSSDMDQGVFWTAVHAGCFHTLMAYTLVDYCRRPARYTTEDVSLGGQAGPGQDQRSNIVDLDSDDTDAFIASGPLPSKVFAVGRNTHAQLGLGFASQEATRGMMSGTITGSGGITHLVAGGNGFSFVVTQSAPETDEKTSTVYGIGNDTLGGLGQGSEVEGTTIRQDPWDVVSTSSEPQLVLYPLPKPVTLPLLQNPASGWTVAGIAAGMDHSLLLLNSGEGQQHLVSTGLNTDGQLGLSTDDQSLPVQPLLTRSFEPVPLPPTSATITQVACGADSSFVVTEDSDLWVWGNSEYGQCLCGLKDRILQPTLVRNPLPEAYQAYDLGEDGVSPRIKKLVSGGSFTAILDTNGRVWVAGYGPIPQQPGSSDLPMKTHDTLQLVENYGDEEAADCVAQDLFCGLEYIVVVTQSRNAELPTIWMWGIPPPSVSTLPMRVPTRIPYALTDALTIVERSNQPQDMRVQHMACNKDHLIVILADSSSSSAASYQVWAECITPTALSV